jgi:hypothetical protein
MSEQIRCIEVHSTQPQERTHALKKIDKTPFLSKDRLLTCVADGEKCLKFNGGIGKEYVNYSYLSFEESVTGAFLLPPARRQLQPAAAAGKAAAVAGWLHPLANTRAQLAVMGWPTAAAAAAAAAVPAKMIEGLRRTE